VALFGAAGLAVDIGRMYITKNEAQTYSDAAAISAAIELDGTADGLNRADAAVVASTNKWNFATTVFSGTVTEYSADGLTGWATSASAAPVTSRYARVTANVTNLPLFFLPVVGAATSSIGFTTTVKASAVAGQVLRSPTVFPFSPVAHKINCTSTGLQDPALPDLHTTCDPTKNFGFEIGQQYDLKWPQSPTVSGGAKAPCDGDNAQPWINMVDGYSAPPQLGGIAFSGTSGFMAQIADDTRPYSPPLTIGNYLLPTNGEKNAIVDAFNNRGDLDNQTNVVYQPGVTDIKNNTTYGPATVSTTYTGGPGYTGRRRITVMVRSGYNYQDGSGPLPTAQQSVGVGYAQFLLLPDYSKSGGGNNAWCATYIGNDVLYGTGNTGVGTDGLGVAYVRLTQ
jgi:Putative Flp pilus-assembly TadE/G-like